MNSANKYNGTVGEILVTLKEEKPNSDDFTKLLKDALHVQNNYLLEALAEYRNINNIDINLQSYFSLKEVRQYIDPLIKYLSADIILKAVLLSSVTTWTNNHFQDDLEEVALKSELINIACNEGANINADNIYLSLKTLVTHKDVLLNQLSADKLLKAAIAATSGRTADPEEVKLQGEFIKIALDRGADINAVEYINFETLIAQKELLLNNSSKPLSSANFLKFALQASTSSFDFATEKQVTDPEKVKIQAELIGIALDQGADINDVIEKAIFGLYIPLNNVLALKEIFFEEVKAHITADNFMQLAITAITSSDEELLLKHKLIEFGLGIGADVNYNANGETFLDMLQAPELIELLKSHGAKCSGGRLKEIYEGGISGVLLKPSIIIEQKYKNLGAVKADDPKVPHTVFHIWLTHPSAPREIRSQDIANVLETRKLFAGSAESWEHIVWTNNKSLIPESTKKLEEGGINVASIYDYQQHLKLFGLIEGLIEKKKWGMASDTLRYSIVEYFGGVYADLNFIFSRDVVDETYKYNFFTMSFGGVYIDNFFFGASAQYPVVERILYLVERNIMTPPSYLGNIKNQNAMVITDMGTANPTYLAYYKEANTNGNVDVVYPIIPRGLLDKSAVQEFPEMAFEAWGREGWAILIQKCPEMALTLELDEYMGSHEICGSISHGIGYDSSDGLTWLL